MAFNTGLSGIRAASGDLDITGNNVANASTVGFKASRAEFADVYTSALLGSGSTPTGSGVILDNVRQEFSQGNISGTESSLDLAIDGNGFFILNNSGQINYSRSGVFGLDKDGFLVGNSSGRVQGYSASDTGIVAGVLGDIQVDISNQAPRLTTQVRNSVNLDSSADVLAQQGTRMTSAGLAVGVADSGIPVSTSSVLNTSGIASTPGVAANTTLPTSLPTTIANTPSAIAAFDVDLNDGNGPQTINLASVAAVVPVITPPAVASTAAEIATANATYSQNMVTEIQDQLNTTLGIGEMTASLDATNNLVLTRSGLHATDGSTFSISNPDANFTAAFGPIAAVNTGVAGSPLFVGSTPIFADFRSVPGTSTTTRTTAPPPLDITADVPGSMALLVGSVSGTHDFSAATGNATNFTVSVDGVNHSISLSDADGNLGTATDTNQNIVDAINGQLAVSAAPGVPGVVASVNGSGFIELTNAAPSINGDSLQIADLASTGALNLASLGFATNNRSNSGAADIEANNEFVIEATGVNPGGPFTIVIPPASYSNVNELAAEIQSQINTNIGAGGVAGKISVEAAGGQLVFTNQTTGTAEGIALSATTTEPQALSALNLNNVFEIPGVDEIDRSNSFRISLTVPAPDTDNRSGSAVLTLDEEYRSVQQLAASINRQINSLSTDDFIGVRAEAVETSPGAVPPTFELRFVALEEGEASVISVSELISSGNDVSLEEMAGVLQVDSNNIALFAAGEEGVTNEYPATSVDIVDPDGNITTVSTTEDMTGNEIASLFNQQPGLSASATTEMTITQSGFNNPGDTITLTLNGQTLAGANTLSELSTMINGFRSSTLPAINADIDVSGNLIITSEIGQDLVMGIDSPVVTDSIVVQGAQGTGPVTLGGNSSADQAASVGGSVEFTLNEGYTMQNPVPSVTGIFSSLTPTDFTEFTINAFDPENQDTYNYATSINIFDSLGNSHVMTQFMVREPADPSRPTAQNLWNMYVLVDGQDVGDPDPTLPFPQNLEPTRSRHELFFNTDGSLNTDSTQDILISNWDPLDENGVPTGALGSLNILEGGMLPVQEPPVSSNFEVVLEGSTQYGAAFGVTDRAQDGYTTGRLSGLDVSDEGVIFARYTNGQAQTLGQVAIAGFRAPEGLIPQGSTMWSESYESGDPSVGTPGSSSFGSIRSSSLEDSNVDLSEELVGLIIAQRNFQASAKTIETADAITQTIINLR